MPQVEFFGITLQLKYVPELMHDYKIERASFG
jgi:hypothetical protein